MTTKMMIWRRVFLIGVLPGEPILRLMTVPYARGAPAGAPRAYGTVMSLSMGSPGSTPIKKTLRHIIIFVVIVAALYLLLPQVVDTEKTLALLSEASYWLLGMAVVLEVLATLSYANLFRFVLSVLDIRLRIVEVLAITLTSLAVSHVLSAGGVGGWIVTYNALRKRRVPHGLIFVAIAAQQFFNYVVLWFFFALAMLYLTGA